MTIRAVVGHVGGVLGCAPALFGEAPSSDSWATTGAASRLDDEEPVRLSARKTSDMFGGLAAGYSTFAGEASPAWDGLSCSGD